MRPVPAFFSPLLVVAALLAAVPAHASGVRLEEQTWTEVRDALRAGTTTVIVPVGGTEQSGPHIALGKHNARVAAFADRIAAQLGNALVAPVLAYVPEGRVSPPTGHMRFAGTISVPDDAFAAILAGAARSLRQHGFADIVLIGDHGDYQPVLRRVAEQLNREWAASGARVHYIAAYYQASTAGFAQLLRGRGFAAAEIGEHAGLADTSLTLAANPALVRLPLLGDPLSASREAGVTGNPARASAALGQAGADAIVSAATAAIREAIAAAHRK